MNNYGNVGSEGLPKGGVRGKVQNQEGPMCGQISMCLKYREGAARIKTDDMRCNREKGPHLLEVCGAHCYLHCLIIDVSLVWSLFVFPLSVMQCFTFLKKLRLHKETHQQYPITSFISCWSGFSCDNMDSVFGYSALFANTLSFIILTLLYCMYIFKFFLQ